MDHHFRQREPVVFNRNNMTTVSEVLGQTIDEFKGEIEAWSQRGSGWVVEAVLAAYVNVARYQPFRGGSYFPGVACKAEKQKKRSSMSKTVITSA